MADEIGPALPPGFLSKKTTSNKSDSDGTVGPMATTTSKHKPIKESLDTDSYGPTLPSANSGVSKQPASRVIGPSLPAGFSCAKQSDDESNHTDGDDDSVKHDSGEDSDDELVGPTIDMAAPKGVEYDAAAEFADRYRSLEAEKKRAEEEKAVAQGAREEWMMSLPTIGLPQDIGVTARTFRNKPATEQDSSWTMTPEERRKKAAEGSKPSHSSKKRHHKESQLSKQDEEISKKLLKYNESSRKESLVDMHQKKLKKEKKAGGEEKAERVPFSRETDLQVNRFDEAQRKSVLKKAALLDTRFGHGSQKYE